MEPKMFMQRLTELRMQKGVSARDMSLSIGQSAGYINNIENGVNYPSMSAFFFICDYLGVTPQEFFETENTDPVALQELRSTAKTLSSEQLNLLLALAKDMQKK